jgi:probable phosphoglycerate mutase
MSFQNDLWLVRHGETDWSLSGQHTSRTDLPLRPEGERRARQVGEKLHGKKFALALSSPMKRALETARLAGIAPEIDQNLREWDYGDYEGMTTAEIQKVDPGWTIWTKTPNGGETAAQVAARADHVIARVTQAAGNVIVFGHGHMLRVLAARWLGLEPQAGRYFALSTGSINVLGEEREIRVVKLWNETNGVAES